jgi:hypothetical protein
MLEFTLAVNPAGYQETAAVGANFIESRYQLCLAIVVVVGL